MATLRQTSDMHNPAVLSAAVPASVSVATHYYTTGPAFDVEDYLFSRASYLLFMAHPLYEGGLSFFREYRHGSLTQTGDRRGNLGFRRFASELATTVRWCKRTRINTEVFLAGDSFLALAGFWLRRTKRTRKVLIYSMDYVPRRFPDAVRNTLYHRIDSFAVRHADIVWNVSDAIAAARERRDPIGRKAPQITVPVGSHYHRIRRRAIEEADDTCIGFLGQLVEKQGLQVMIRALPLVRRTVTNATLLVVGEGPYRPVLARLAEDLGVGNAVHFTGFVQDHRTVEGLLANCAIAVAPYVPDPLTFTRFADPGKIKNYLACGLPIVTTDVPQISVEIQRRGAGSITPYDEDALAQIIVSYLNNREKLVAARQAAAQFGAEFAWDRILDAAWGATAALT